MEKIVIVGDSTASIKEPSARPETGWGEKISRYLPQHQIVNLAKNGRSSKSFIEEGRLLQAKKELHAGDYLLIQFGHNDQKTDSRGTTPVEYQHNLATFVQTARQQQATPILLTSITRLHYVDQQQLDPLAVGPYPEAMRALATSLDVVCLDLFAATQRFFSALEPQQAKTYFLHLEKNQHPNYPAGITDNTHLNDQGATAVAKLVAKCLTNTPLPLAQQVLLD